MTYRRKQQSPSTEPARPEQLLDPTAGRSAGTAWNAEKDPTRGRSAGSPRNLEMDPTRAQPASHLD